MQTVSTLCASGTALSLSAVGLTLARSAEDLTQPSNKQHHYHHHHHHQHRDPTAIAAATTHTNEDLFRSSPRSGMTAIADYQSIQLSHAHKKAQQAYPSPITRPQTASALPTFDTSSEKKTREKHVSREGSRDLHTPIDSILEAELEHLASRDRKGSGLGTGDKAVSRPLSWLRRLSSSMSTSRESSRTPTSQASSRPSSAVFSPADVVTSDPLRSDSSTQELSSSISAKQPRNRLVKRTTSLRENNGSPLSENVRSRLPILKRPVTSYQRSSYIQEIRAHSQRSELANFQTPDHSTQPLRTYFTPHVPPRRSPSVPGTPISGIPNPIRRVYPDRKYTPMLVSAGTSIRPAGLETDANVYDSETGGDEDYDSVDDTSDDIPKVTSISQPSSARQLRQSPPPRRSFSIADLLSAGPQPFWKSSSGRKTPTNKLIRRVRPRVFSLPPIAMSNSFAPSTSSESERPHKRRDITDPAAYSRSIYTSSSSATNETRQTNDLQQSSGSTAQTSGYSIPVSPNLTSVAQDRCVTPLDRHSPVAPASLSMPHSARVSAAYSEVPSTIGSDSEPLSLSDYSTEYQNDMMYDSLPTRATRSSFGKRGPPIETIFDESPHTFSSGRSTRLRDFLSDGHYYSSDMNATFRHSTIEEEGSVLSTPVRSIRDHSVTSTPSARPRVQTILASSPPSMYLATDVDDIDWDVAADLDVNDTPGGLDVHHDGRPQSARTTPLHLARMPHLSLPLSSHSTPNRGGFGNVERASLFDWSEQQPSPSRGAYSPQRPKTVHGKKDAETRGSRATGRRPVSGMHARSHSVPVVPDVDGKRNTAVANKFGTWGVGSKGVTEDWNEDFDFEDPPNLPSAPSQPDDRRIDSGHEMFVPKSIREQQENVVANISLLREWGLLIEELKDLRIRAAALGMLSGSFVPAWEEVDAMIELADQETEEQTLEPRISPPSSPGFDYSAFEDSIHTPERPGRSRKSLGQVDTSMTDNDSPGLGFAFESSPTPSRRPRKNSEAVARMVIEALQSKRNFAEASVLRRSPANRKVPFDTATLRHIVPYVNGLKRRIKDALRETEGLYTSPHRRTTPQPEDSPSEHEEAPAFQSIFANSGATSSAPSGVSRRGRTVSEGGDDDVFIDLEQAGIIGRLEALRIPP